MLREVFVESGPRLQGRAEHTRQQILLREFFQERRSSGSLSKRNSTAGRSGWSNDPDAAESWNVEYSLSQDNRLSWAC